MKPINVTKSFLPDLEQYLSFISRAWNNEWLTNRGELVLELEEVLRRKYDINHIILTSNGTIPLQIALKLLALKGEVITTPFSYVATTSTIVWENCTPVFVDIDAATFNINTELIEKAITPKTTTILATHVFGNPCNVEKIEEIARIHNLAVIYDAAHCFGVTYKDQSIFNYGDISTCSFHATKLFHTAEGGALCVNNVRLQEIAYYSHNFGHDGPLKFHGLGINAKMSELQAAMGLAMIPNMEVILRERKKVVDFYNANLNLENLNTLEINADSKWNFSYYPLLFNTKKQLECVESALNDSQIYPRRYFSPSLNYLPYVNYKFMPVSEKVSDCILCLPLYVGLTVEDLELIVNIINSSI